jgi:hypothetical protein
MCRHPPRVPLAHPAALHAPAVLRHVQAGTVDAHSPPPPQGQVLGVGRNRPPAAVQVTSWQARPATAMA